jgi:hypothetical protein
LLQRVAGHVNTPEDVDKLVTLTGFGPQKKNTARRRSTLAHTNTHLHSDL